MSNKNQYIRAVRPIPDDDDYFPGPLILVTQRDDQTAEEKENSVWNDSEQSHLRFTNTVVPNCLSHGDPVREWAGGKETDECTGENAEIGKSDTLCTKVVRWSSENLRLSKIAK